MDKQAKVFEDGVFYGHLQDNGVWAMGIDNGGTGYAGYTRAPRLWVEAMRIGDYELLDMIEERTTARTWREIADRNRWKGNSSTRWPLYVWSEDDRFGT